MDFLLMKNKLNGIKTSKFSGYGEIFLISFLTFLLTSLKEVY